MINMLILFLKRHLHHTIKAPHLFQRGFSRSSASQPSFTGRSLTQQWQLKWLNTNQQIPCNGAYSFRNSSWNLNLHFFLYNYSMVCINDRSSSVWLSGYLKLILSADSRFTVLLPRPTKTVPFFSPFCQLVWSMTFLAYEILRQSEHQTDKPSPFMTQFPCGARLFCQNKLCSCYK